MNFSRQWQRQATQSYAGAWGGANVALVSQRPQATTSTLVGFGAPLHMEEAETAGHWGVTAQPPLPRSPTRRLTRLSRPALVTTRIGAG